MSKAKVDLLQRRMKLSAKTMKGKKNQINIKHEKAIPIDAIEVLFKKTL